MSQVSAIESFPGRECCDFCTAEPTHRLYACRNFMWLKHAMFAHESIGAWAACEECARLVDGGKWSELRNELWPHSNEYRATLRTKSHASGIASGRSINFSKST